jgi:dethiobiotin synthetase
MKQFFITATGTEIGKTLVTTALCHQLIAQGKRVQALKPVISGYNAGDQMCDSAQILQSCGLSSDEAAIAAISPWRYEAALAPNMAAAREGNPVMLPALLHFCAKAAEQNADITLIEGAGGVMAPVNDRYTMLDWMQRLGLPVIVVGGSYLGAISHTLTSIDALVNRGLNIAAIIVSESENSGVALDETVSTLEKFLPHAIAVEAIPRFPAQPMPWKAVAPLTKVLTGMLTS